ncbi:hypothetical protein B0H17DRAFT_1205060 [Mycena rosella]|uniref:Uncharacterized protein n=1 Tax=Mycena rosella TaxID=1033263 RepID=A0AAD7D842_MYCRO|nr:hypothetical protein B0H17DRAFT_1205060 [Mycena rosella]
MMKMLDLDHALRGLIQPPPPVRPKLRPKSRDAGPLCKSMRLAYGKTIKGDEGGGARGQGKGKGNEADSGGNKGRGVHSGGARKGNKHGWADGGGAQKGNKLVEGGETCKGDELRGSHGKPTVVSMDGVSEHEKQRERALEEGRCEQVELEYEKESGGKKESEHEREQGHTIDLVGSVDKTGWPMWMQNRHTLMSACRGNEWDDIVETRITLEKAYSFQTPAAAMPRLTDLRKLANGLKQLVVLVEYAGTVMAREG